MPERIPTSEPDMVTGEVPSELLGAILADAEARCGSESDELGVVRAEQVVWNDGSLGCPRPGTIYTQARVNGYRIVLRYGDQELDYRASQSGFFLLCERH
jgi:hypothetical protein